MLKKLVLIRLESLFATFMQANKDNKKKKGNQKGSIVGYIILMVFLFLCLAMIFGGVFYKLCDGFAALNLQWLYFSMAGLFAFFLCFIGSVFIAQTQIFQAKDNEMLFSMPIKPGYILISRLIALLLLNYLYETIIMLPAGIVFFVLASEYVTTVGVIAFILSALLLPLLSMALTIVLAWIIEAISAKMKYKNIITMVFNIVFFGAYMLVCFRWQEYVGQLVANGMQIAEAIKQSVPPIYHMGVAIADGNLLSMLLFAVMCLVPIIIIYTALSKTFVKIATTKKGAAKIKYKHGEMKVSSVKKALFNKEFTHFVGSPMYMFNAAIGLVFIIIGAVFLAIKSDEMSMLIQIIDPTYQLVGVAATGIMLFMCSTNIISTPTISLEAKTLWMLKSMPITPKEALMSKVKLHVYCSIPFVIIGAVLMIMYYPMTTIGKVMLILLPLIFVVLTGIMGVMLNLKFYNFNWTNESYAIKQGMAPFLSIILAMLLVAIPAGIYVILFYGETYQEMFLIGMFLVYLVITFVLYRMLITKGIKMFEDLPA